MMEQWNPAPLSARKAYRPEGRAYGLERIMQCWINGPATDGIDDKIKMVNILLKTNIPAFHHSIIPFSGQIRMAEGIGIRPTAFGSRPELKVRSIEGGVRFATLVAGKVRCNDV
jgi:hypothetical protein